MNKIIRNRLVKGIVGTAKTDIVAMPARNKGIQLNFSKNENKEIKAYATKQMRTRDNSLGHVCSVRVANEKRKREEEKRRNELNIKASRKAKINFNRKRHEAVQEF